MKKKITLILLLFASCYSFAQNFTLKVTVPATTIVCYIGGDLNGWTPQPLTLLSSNIMTKVFKIDILKEKFTNVFKILSGPEWKYEQVEDNWSAADVKEDVGITVSAFKAIFNPTTSAMSIDFNKPTQAQNLLDGHWKFTTGDISIGYEPTWTIANGQK